MENPIFILSGLIFGVLLIFLAFIFTIFIISLFTRERAVDFKPNISIIVPAFNEEENLRECLLSIYSSSYPPDLMEVIVIDDGSTDRTAAIAREFSKAKLIAAPHNGKSNALNKGIEASSREFIVTVDADMVLDRKCIEELVKPFSNSNIGATTANCKVKNNNGILGLFQDIEYHYNNLISNSFSKVFKNSMWFFGAVACYRKDALKKAGSFKKVLAEDMLIALDITKAGYKTANVQKAIGHTMVPASVTELFNQRYRWCIGGLQAVTKNRDMISQPSTFFLAFTQFWGAIYSIICIPLIIYIFAYWLPSNSTSILTAAFYVFRWLNLFGIVYLIYKVNEWGIRYYTLFGVLSGIISTVMILASLRVFNAKISLKNILAITFYFPYTLMLNAIIAISIFSPDTWKLLEAKNNE
ncbi:glycosyltransferase family 2 protein [Candidatus Woesearchaeota archaeon]|nr:glycosyltransferase family 2 protein [Candidatus Woesearchaeota archaeon]